MLLVVVDANVVFSALVRKGKPLKVFELNDIFKEFEFVSSEYMYFELENNMDKLLSLTKLSKEEISKIFAFLKESIEIIPFEVFMDKAKEARSIAPHIEDIPYLALALKFNCSILSGDKELKNEQSKVKVLSPSEALDMLISG